MVVYLAAIKPHTDLILFDFNLVVHFGVYDMLFPFHAAASGSKGVCMCDCE